MGFTSCAPCCVACAGRRNVSVTKGFACEINCFGSLSLEHLLWYIVKWHVSESHCNFPEVCWEYFHTGLQNVCHSVGLYLWEVVALVV